MQIFETNGLYASLEVFVVNMDLFVEGGAFAKIE